MNLDHKLEKPIGRWEFIKNTRKDQADLVNLQKAIDDKVLPPPVEEVSETIEAGDGLFLRLGDKAVGYALFNVEEWGDKKVLFIEYVHVLPSQRNPAVIAQLIHSLKKYANEQRVTHVHWTSGSEEMKRLSRKMPAEDEDRFTIPIEQFGLDGFMGRL
jgi:hypothetical protein